MELFMKFSGCKRAGVSVDGIAYSEIERLLFGQVATCQFCRKRTVGRWIVYRDERSIGPKAYRDSSGRRCKGSDLPALLEPIGSVRRG